MSSIDNYIEENYCVIFKGEPIDRPSDAKEFLLTDYHKNFGALKINSVFINTFATSNDALLLEEYPPNLPIHSYFFSDNSLLNTQAKCFGWDIGSLKNILPLSELFMANRERLGFLLKDDRDDPLEIQATKLINQYVNTIDKKEILLQIADIQKVIAEKVIIKSRRVFENLSLFKQVIKDTFDSRTESMQRSLENAGRNFDKVFLTAGICHLVKEEMLIDSFKIGISLDSFYEFLRSRNVVVLSQKDEKMLEWNEKILPVNLITRNIFQKTELRLLQEGRYPLF